MDRGATIQVIRFKEIMSQIGETNVESVKIRTLFNQV
jgi:hypothetical protein